MNCFDGRMQYSYRRQKNASPRTSIEDGGVRMVRTRTLMPLAQGFPLVPLPVHERGAGGSETIGRCEVGTRVARGHVSAAQAFFGFMEH